MTQGSPSGVSGDVSRGDGSSPREVVEAFAIKARHVEVPFDSPKIAVNVYCTGGEGDTFIVGLGSIISGEFQFWATLAGLETVRDALNAALVRARIARERS